MPIAPEPDDVKYQLAHMAGIAHIHAPSQPTGVSGGESSSSEESAQYTIIDLQGELLPNVQVQLIFWGTAWAGEASPSATEVTQAVQTILAGPYMSGLAQYRNIGKGTFLGTASVTNADPPQPFSNDDVAQLVLHLIANREVPAPEDDQRILYCVMLPGGSSSNLANVDGLHSFVFNVSYTFPFDVDLNQVLYAWVMNDGTLEGMTIIFSHELVESCTNPVGAGIQVLPLDPTNWREIGDVCEGISSEVNGVSVQAYWSQADGACVIPGLLGPSASGAYPYTYQKE